MYIFILIEEVIKLKKREKKKIITNEIRFDESLQIK